MTVIAPGSIFPLPQATWQTVPPTTPLTMLIAKLNVKLHQWAQTLEGCRQGVSGPTWGGTIPHIAAAQTLSPLSSPTMQLIDATAGAFATTMYLSTGSHASGCVTVFKLISSVTGATIVTQSPDVFGDTGGSTLTLGTQYQVIRLWCDGAGTFWEW